MKDTRRNFRRTVEITVPVCRYKIEGCWQSSLQPMI
jgi:hypothetical protein